MLVIKRDGDKQDFSFSKIHRVVERVFCSIKQEVPDGLFDKLDCYLRKNIDLEGEEDVDVDDIHNTIEQFLMVNNLFDASRAYIQCRYNKALKRSENERLMKGISEKLSAANVQNSNANLDESSFGGRLGEATRYVVKDYALNFCMSKKSKMNHLNNEIYIHK